MSWMVWASLALIFSIFLLFPWASRRQDDRPNEKWSIAVALVPLFVGITLLMLSLL